MQASFARRGGEGFSARVRRGGLESCRFGFLEGLSEEDL